MMRRAVIIAGAVVVASTAVLAWRFAPVLDVSVFAKDLSVADEDKLSSRLSLPDGYTLNIYSHGLEGPRLMQLEASGDLIVSETDSGRITIVKRDRDGDGRSDGTETLREGLDMPHGLWLDGGKLYVAEEGRVLRF